MNHDCTKKIEVYYSKKKSIKRSYPRGMDGFLNLKGDDEAEDEKGAVRVKDE